MSYVIDISDWDIFKNMKKLTHEVDAYVHILDYFINTKRNQQDIESFNYYEQMYIKTYMDFIEMKREFQVYLKNYLSENNIPHSKFEWYINYERAEVKVEI